MARNGARTSAKTIRTSERQQRAYALRLEGKTIREIAAELGCSAMTTYRMVEAEIERQMATRDASVKRQQSIVADRLDRLIREVWPRVEQGDVMAIAQVVKIEERRCKLLGLDEPQRVQTTLEVEGLPNHELMAIAARMGLQVAMSALQAADEPEIGLLPGEVEKSKDTVYDVSVEVIGERSQPPSAAGPDEVGPPGAPVGDTAEQPGD